MKTKQPLVITALAATLTACASQHLYPSVPTVRLVREHEHLIIPGQYYQGDGLGWNLNLTLSPTGGYEIVETGCLGEYGRAHGVWNVYNNTLNLRQDDSTDDTFTYPRYYEVLVSDGEPVFLSDLTRSYFRTYGVNRFSCFQRKEAPTKQSSVPVTRGTPPADAGAAPESPVR